MNRRLDRVSHKQVYDLIFRARNAKLNCIAYELDFMDWIKAGIAYNARGAETSTRKISRFAPLYIALQNARVNGASAITEKKYQFSEALYSYYEDIYEIYQDHIASKHAEAKYLSSRSSGIKKYPDFGELLIVPSFKQVLILQEIFAVKQEDLHTYVCKNNDAFYNKLNSSFVSQDSELYRGMSMMYDYGVGRVEPDVLLEVSLWDETE